MSTGEADGMKIGVPKEVGSGERRVALVPEVVRKLGKKKVDVLVQKGAGELAGFGDAAYVEAGAKLVDDEEAVFEEADLIAKVQRLQELPDGRHEIDLVREGQLLFGFMSPVFHARDMERLARKKALVFAVEAIPRTSRAQAMDALSSQANIAGYKAVILAAGKIQKLMPMLMTAAGTISPAKALVIGAGVAGLQAIATAKRLGAVVYGYDVRAAAKEQVLSLGAKFVELDLGESGEGKGGYAKALSEEAQKRQREKLGEALREMDIVISTAAIPGRRAPLLIEKKAVLAMKPGSVIIDLAAQTGGNIEGSKADEEIMIGGTRVLGPTNLPSEMAYDASLVYARNVLSFLDLVIKDGSLSLDFEDDIVQGACITKDGEIVYPPTRNKLTELAQEAA